MFPSLFFPSLHFPRLYFPESTGVIVPYVPPGASILYRTGVGTIELSGSGPGAVMLSRTGPGAVSIEEE